MRHVSVPQYVSSEVIPCTPVAPVVRRPGVSAFWLRESVGNEALWDCAVQPGLRDGSGHGRTVSHASRTPGAVVLIGSPIVLLLSQAGTAAAGMGTVTPGP